MVAHFDRKPIPERMVRAKGAGAFGEFEVTHDITDIVISARLSTVGGEKGSTDTTCNPGGFAVKLQTEDGNWVMVGSNTPVFFNRDVMQLLGDRGTPLTCRFTNTCSGHTFRISISHPSMPRLTHAHRIRATKPCQQLMQSVSPTSTPVGTCETSSALSEPAVFLPGPLTSRSWPPPTQNLRAGASSTTLNGNPQKYFAPIEHMAVRPVHLVPCISPSADVM
ncbi:heme-dependent catalase [Aulographum hederae CBS 113979]|uniref:Heme-dependent catalase n=1 Tax=Aulographum hederae CBS 113979 TaxID=1176131 RepID=A0A6G1GLG4_9PEZI|nr:heme-dependent catalase [Aulographum hederae CBS 113979]